VPTSGGLRGSGANAGAGASLSTSTTSIEGGTVDAVCGNGGDDDDLDTEMVRVKPERPRLIWKDGSFQENTLTALNYMRKNKHFCDVTLQIGQHDIPAHRVVLAAASPYWMELFTSEEDQPTRKEVEIDGGMLYELNGGFQKEALERLVEYSYTARLEVPGDQVKPVYMAAIRLKMSRVAGECARFMLNQLDLSSCLDLRSMPGIAMPDGSRKLSSQSSNGGNSVTHSQHLNNSNGHSCQGGVNGVNNSSCNGNGVMTADSSPADIGMEFISRVDDFIEANFEALEESRELRSLPRIRIEILHLSKEEKDQALARPLCELALDWIRSQWIEDEKLDLETLSQRRNLLFVAGDHTLQDCDIIEQGSVNDSDVIQDYKKENQHFPSKLAKKRRQPGVPAAVRPSKPRELLYSRHINQDDHAKQADVEDGWKVIASAKLAGNDQSILAIVTIDRHLATFSIMQRVNRPSSPQGPHDLPPTMSASDLQEKGVRIPRSPKISRPPSIERDLVYASVAPMPAPKCAVGAACLNGKLVVCGGYDRGECLNSFESYDITSNKWSKLPSMLGKRGRFDVASTSSGTTDSTDKAVSHRLYAVAGSNGQVEENSVEMFDSSTGKWKYVASLPVRLSNIGVTELEGAVYCIGGTYGPSGTKYCFKLEQGPDDKWDRIANMITGRAQAAVASFQGKIWVAGGCNAWNAIRSVEIYDPVTNTWKEGPSLSTPRRGCGLAVHQGHLIVVGGSDGTHSLCTTEVLDMAEGGWKPGPTMTTCRTNVSVAVVGDRLWAVGGFSGKVFLNTVEYLDGDEWTSFIPLPEQMFKSTKSTNSLGSKEGSLAPPSAPRSGAGSGTASEDEESSVITFAAAASGKAETQESERAPPSGEKEDNDAKSATMTSSSTRDLKGETEIESPQHEDKVNSSNSSSENLQEVEQASQEGEVDDVEPTEEETMTEGGTEV